MPDETFRTLYVDPGDETGWAVACGFKLLAGGQTKLWTFADEVWDALTWPSNPEKTILSGDQYARAGISAAENAGPIGRVVCEDFKIYPWKAKELGYNPVRTARLIGALTWMAHHYRVPFVLQPAAIKDLAEKAGASELFVLPLTENRHQNDAIRHFCVYNHLRVNPNAVSQVQKILRSEEKGQ